MLQATSVLRNLAMLKEKDVAAPGSAGSAAVSIFDTAIVEHLCQLLKR